MSDFDESTLGRHRRLIRMAHDLTQEDVVKRARKAGHRISVDTLATAERGESVSERSLRAICAGIGCDLGLYVTPGAPVSVATPEPTR